jgi:hypothetical protein
MLENHAPATGQNAIHISALATGYTILILLFAETMQPNGFFLTGVPSDRS